MTFVEPHAHDISPIEYALAALPPPRSAPVVVELIARSINQLTTQLLSALSPQDQLIALTVIDHGVLASNRETPDRLPESYHWAALRPFTGPSLRLHLGSSQPCLDRDAYAKKLGTMLGSHHAKGDAFEYTRIDDTRFLIATATIRRASRAARSPH